MVCLHVHEQSPSQFRKSPSHTLYRHFACLCIPLLAGLPRHSGPTRTRLPQSPYSLAMLPASAPPHLGLMTMNVPDRTTQLWTGSFRKTPVLTPDWESKGGWIIIEMQRVHRTLSNVVVAEGWEEPESFER
jgi:hypothetical protein